MWHLVPSPPFPPLFSELGDVVSTNTVALGHNRYRDFPASRAYVIALLVCADAEVLPNLAVPSWTPSIAAPIAWVGGLEKALPQLGLLHLERRAGQGEGLGALLLGEWVSCAFVGFRVSF